VTLDRTPDGGWTPGGPSLYASRASAALGADVSLVTGLEDDFDRSVLNGLDVRASQIPAHLPRYANSYDANGDRTQLLLAEGDPLELVPRLKPGETPDVVFLTPAYHEFRRAPLRFKGSLVGVSLQGPLRSKDGDNRVIHHPEPRAVANSFIRAGWIAFFSEEDTADPDALAGHISRLRGVAVLTRGYNGATLFDSDGSNHHWDAIAAAPVDPTGAGDCFASAFMFRLAETEELASAMRFALAAGSLAVEGQGLAGVPTRQAIEARMTREAA
jgi:sugar/nucleoside kinase (ribokinase family)